MMPWGLCCQIIINKHLTGKEGGLLYVESSRGKRGIVKRTDSK
jgi:hypothetical protein